MPAGPGRARGRLEHDRLFEREELAPSERVAPARVLGGDEVRVRADARSRLSASIFGPSVAMTRSPTGGGSGASSSASR